MGVAKRKQPRKPYTWRTRSGVTTGGAQQSRAAPHAQRPHHSGWPAVQHACVAVASVSVGRAKEAGCGSGMGRAGALGPQWNDAQLAKLRAAAAAAWQRTQLEDAGGEQRLHAPQRGADRACGQEQRVQRQPHAKGHLPPPGAAWRHGAPRKVISRFSSCLYLRGRTRKAIAARRSLQTRLHRQQRMPAFRSGPRPAHPSDSRYAVSAVSESMDAMAPGG
jgi:hypothetical protein